MPVALFTTPLFRQQHPQITANHQIRFTVCSFPENYFRMEDLFRLTDTAQTRQDSELWHSNASLHLNNTERERERDTHTHTQRDTPQTYLSKQLHFISTDCASLLLLRAAERSCAIKGNITSRSDSLGLPPVLWSQRAAGEGQGGEVWTRVVVTGVNYQQA